MRPIPFAKLSGSGNDFILIDNREGWVDAKQAAQFAQAVCRRALSVGADGLILIENDPAGAADFAWRFYNADGSMPDMCGNGGRCAARFAHQHGIAGANMSFVTGAGLIRAEITGDRTVKLQMTPPADYRPAVDLEWPGGARQAKVINTGVPHAVIEVKDVDAVDVKTEGPAVRNHPVFAPEGANANFVQVTGPDALLIRTYERGVEGETLACGTGAVAAAMTMALAGRVAPPVRLTTRSAEVLRVYFDVGDDLPQEVFFEGTVNWVYDGVLLPESLL